MKEDKQKKTQTVQQTEEANSGFINEEVTPANRAIKRKKLLLTALAVVTLAVLFGVIARGSYEISDYLFSEMISGGGRDNVNLRPSPSVSIPNVDGEVRPPIVSDGNSLEQYNQLMSGVREVSTVLSACLTKISVIRSEEDPIFSAGNSIEQRTSGVILANNNVEYLVMVSYSECFKKAYDRITVTFVNGVKADATLLAKNEDIDLAILAVPHKDIDANDKKDIAVISIGDSSELTLGSVVVALGMPNGRNESIDVGLVTMLGDTQFITDTSVDVMETNMVRCDHAAGILVNIKGELVGIISEHFSTGRNNLSALTINSVSTMLQYMLNGIRTIGFGAVLYDLTDELQQALDVPCGIAITAVHTGTPAYESGFRKGDVITHVGEEKLYYASQFYTLLNQHDPGEEMEITYYRGGKEYKMTMEAKRNDK